jgi:DNA repair protein RadC
MTNTYKNILNERIEKYGINTLSDEEALSALTGIPVTEARTAIEIYGLPELIMFTNNLKLTKAQCKKLELLYHMTKRISVSNFKEKSLLNSSTSAGDYFLKELQFLRNEVFAVALLDSQNRLIRTVIVSNGTINEAPVYTREIVRTVLDNNANSVILGHNHPGGGRHPSNPDLEVTKRIVEALNTINVKVIDHIIVSENNFTSFAEKGLI